MKVSYISFIIESAKIIQNYSLFFCITLVIPVRCRRRRNEICVVNIRLGRGVSGKLSPVRVRVQFRISVRIRAGGIFLGSNFPRTDWGEWISYRHHLIFKHDASKFMFCHHFPILWKLFEFKRQGSTKKLFFAFLF